MTVNVIIIYELFKQIKNINYTVQKCIFIADFLHKKVMNIYIKRHGYFLFKKTTMVLTCIKSQKVKIKFLPSQDKGL